MRCSTAPGPRADRLRGAVERGGGHRDDEGVADAAENIGGERGRGGKGRGIYEGEAGDGNRMDAVRCRKGDAEGAAVAAQPPRPPFGHSRASAAAQKARQNNNSEVRAVKRITIRAPSTSNSRMPAIQTLKSSNVSASRRTAASHRTSFDASACLDPLTTANG